MLSNNPRALTEGLPSLPPAYEDRLRVSRDSLDQADSQPLEQFEIDEDEVYEPAKRGSLLERLTFRSKRALYLVRDRFITPFVLLLAPLLDAYKFISTRYEETILKLGNPLVVKRLLYVFAVVVIMYAVPMGANNDGVNGASGGAFSSGKFYDVNKLADTLTLFISASTLKENTEYLSSMPHFAGSTGDLALARYVESYFSFNGINMINFEELNSFLNFPIRDGTYLKLDDGSFEATLYENNGEQMQDLAFNPNSPSSEGEIYAHYIYAGEGSDAEIAELHQKGIDIKDSVLLIKYGGKTPEANKVAMAHRFGAKAVIFITPKVNWAGSDHDEAIQKSNVGLTRYSPGDVLTPGWSSQNSHATRLSWDKSVVTAKIPCIPISHKDGEQLLKKLKHRGIQYKDEFWSGDKSDSEKIRLRITHEERKTHLIWNVVGSISGREQADKGIIFGASRDSVGLGASTSASSTAVLLELVKAFTSLQRRFDWSPSRSIYFISFDASEYNLAGSAEWVESKKKQLEAEGYTYIEIGDVHVGDLMSLTANPLLHNLLKDELKKVEIPRSKEIASPKVSLYDLFREQNMGSDKISSNFLQSKNYLPFVNIVNVPSMDIGFRKEGIPRLSCLDSFSNFEKELDLLMQYHVAVLELLARVGLRLAEEPLIPYDFNVLAETLKDYGNDLERFVRDIISGIKSDVIPQMHYDSLRHGLDRLTEGALAIEGFRRDWAAFIQSSSSLEPVMLAATRRTANENMVKFNEVFLARGGIPDRAGYINFLFGVPYDAPDHKDETYHWSSFPMVRDFAMKGEFGKAQFEITRISELLDAASRVLLAL